MARSLVPLLLGVALVFIYQDMMVTSQGDGRELWNWKSCTLRLPTTVFCENGPCNSWCADAYKYGLGVCDNIMYCNCTIPCFVKAKGCASQC